MQIQERGHFATVRHIDPELLQRALSVIRHRFRAGKNGVSQLTVREAFFELGNRREVQVPAGLVPRLQQTLRARKQLVQHTVSEMPIHEVSHGVIDELGANASPLMRALADRVYGQIVVNNRDDEVSAITDIAAMYPGEAILVLTKDHRSARKLFEQLRPTLRKRAHTIWERAREPRNCVKVACAALLADEPIARRYTVAVWIGSEPLTALQSWRTEWTQFLNFALINVRDVLSRHGQMMVESRCGPVVFRFTSSRQQAKPIWVSWIPFRSKLRILPGNAFGHVRNAENQDRNCLIAKLADALTRCCWRLLGELGFPHLRQYFATRHKGMFIRPKVAVVVESREHALRMGMLLSSWPICTSDEWPKEAATSRSIILTAEALRTHVPAVNVLLRATGGSSDLEAPCLRSSHRPTPMLGMLIADLADLDDGENVARRFASYRRRGFEVPPPPEINLDTDFLERRLRRSPR